MKHESVKLAVSREDGSVAIMTFLTVGRGPGLPQGGAWVDEKAGVWMREPSDENVFFEIQKTFFQPPLATGYRRITDADVPSDRAYRGAWTDDRTKIGHDMIKARAIHLEVLRAVRAKKLAQLDGEWMRAIGQGDKAAADRIESDRQTLRDLPVTLEVENVVTIEILKGRWHPLLD